jgi:butyryl-CoA dehydrogenase
MGGMQLPCMVEAAANAFFAKASVSIGAGMLTSGQRQPADGARHAAAAAGLRAATSSPAAGRHHVPERAAGGLSLSDVATRADARRRQRPVPGSRPAGPALPACAATRCGSPPASTSSPRTSSTWCWPRSPGRTASRCRAREGISLFIVPKHLVDAEGRLTGERNDVALAGLNHKCGWRGTTNTLLNFGEGRFRPRTGPATVLDGAGRRRGGLPGGPARARACAACST